MKVVNKELQLFALIVHSMLAVLHFLGIVYNARRKNRRDTIAHTLAFCYDLHCAYKHYRAVKEAE